MSGLFMTEKELAQLRDDVKELHYDTCNILRVTLSNAGGYATQTWGTAGTALACRIDPSGAERYGNQVRGEQESRVLVYKLYLPWDADVFATDRVEHDGVIYDIIDLVSDHSNNIWKSATLSHLSPET